MTEEHIERRGGSRARPAPTVTAALSLIDAGDNTVPKLSISLGLAVKTTERFCCSLKSMGFIHKNGREIAVVDGFVRLKYTIGHSPSYFKGLSDLGKHFTKLGATDGHDRPDGKPYLGGSIFHTMDDAERFLKTMRQSPDQKFLDYEVFGVLTERADDLKQLQGEEFFRLQHDRRIVALPWEGE